MIYINFAHPEPDAWNTVVDYLRSTPVFREPPESRGNHGAKGEATWHTSITIPHFILAPPESTDRKQAGEEFQPEFYFERPPTATGRENTLQDACMSICMTGDGFGEFWTASLLGTVNSCQQNSSDENLSQPNTDEKIRKVLERYKYNKYSTRNLMFVLQLSRACHTISKRFENILEKMEEKIELEVAGHFPGSNSMG